MDKTATAGLACVLLASACSQQQAAYVGPLKPPEPQFLYTKMHLLTVHFCERVRQPDCIPLKPLKLTFAFSLDCEIAKGNIVSGYERSDAFDITQDATCEPIARRIAAYSSAEAVEVIFDDPDIVFSDEP